MPTLPLPITPTSSPGYRVGAYSQSGSVTVRIDPSVALSTTSTSTGPGSADCRIRGDFPTTAIIFQDPDRLRRQSPWMFPAPCPIRGRAISNELTTATSESPLAQIFSTARAQPTPIDTTISLNSDTVYGINPSANSQLGDDVADVSDTASLRSAQGSASTLRTPGDSRSGKAQIFRTRDRALAS